MPDNTTSPWPLTPWDHAKAALSPEEAWAQQDAIALRYLARKAAESQQAADKQAAAWQFPMRVETYKRTPGNPIPCMDCGEPCCHTAKRCLHCAGVETQRVRHERAAA